MDKERQYLLRKTTMLSYDMTILETTLPARICLLKSEYLLSFDYYKFASCSLFANDRYWIVILWESLGVNNTAET